MKTQASLFFILLIGLNLSGQRHPRDIEKIEAYKARYLTEALNLSPETAQKFWPVYNQYQKETRQILKDHSELPPPEDAKPSFENLSDAEIEKMILEKLNDQKKLADLKIQYFEKFKECLGTRGAADYYRAELDFHRRLMRELGKRRRKSP